MGMEFFVIAFSLLSSFPLYATTLSSFSIDSIDTGIEHSYQSRQDYKNLYYYSNSNNNNNQHQPSESRRGKAIPRPCPAPFDKLYCFNRGKCYYAEYFRYDNISPYCKCARNYEGARCEHLFNSNVYGFTVSNNELENKALSTVAVILFLTILGFLWCLLLHRRLINTTVIRNNNKNNNTTLPIMTDHVHV